MDNSFEISSYLNISSEVIVDKNERLTDVNVNGNYPYLCPKCYSIPKLDIDFQSNNYNIICDNNHKYTFNSYSSFKENASKKLNNLLCQNCMVCPNDKSQLYRCNNCFLFFCESCKLKHKEESYHSNFIELNSINKFPINNLKFSSSFGSTTEFEKEYLNIMESKKIYENFKKEMLNIFNDMYSKITSYFEVFDNFFLVYKNIIEFSKNNINVYKSNFNTCLNFELFFRNEIEMGEYLKKVYEAIKIKELDHEKLSSFIKFVYEFDDESIISVDYIHKEGQILKNNNSNQDSEPPQKILKIDELTKMKIIIDELSQETQAEIKSFCPFDSNRYIIFGTKSGEILIYQIPKNKLTPEKEETFKFKIGFKVFETEIKLICQLDLDLIAVSDGRNTIKIIQLEDDISQYSIIQTILHESYDAELIFSMIPLAKFSSREKHHYFCISDNNHILIYKSNKKPKARKNYKYKDDNDPLNFKLSKDIVLNTLTHCLIEVNEKYLVASCNERKTIVFFDMRKNFKQVSEIENVYSTYGRNIFSMIPNKNILIVGCKDGFIYINTDKIKKIKKIQCRYNVLSLNVFDYTIICSCIDQNVNKIKQYEINEESYNINKVSERLVFNNEQIWKIQKINDRIFFLNGQNIVNYLT